MSNWTYVRLTLVLFSGIASFFVPLGPQATPSIDWGSLLVIFIFCPIGLVLILAIQVVNPRSAKAWRRPSWSINPFNFREPLQFFHAVAYVCLAQGLVTLVRVAALSIPFYVEALVPLVMAVGIFIGLQAVMLLFRSKLEHGS